MLTPGVQVPLAPGISAGRTTYLHYWQPGITFSANGTLLNTTEPIAFYRGPAPPPGDGFHTYVFYLFEQGASFAPPSAGNPFSTALVNGKMGMNRLSFSVSRVANEQGIGPLAGANYFLSQNTSAATSTASAAPTATGGASSQGTGSVIGATPVPFTGGAGSASPGLMVGIATCVAFGFGLLYMA